MAETHIFQSVGALILAMWWTRHWIMDQSLSRWRFVASAFAGTILWIITAYIQTRAAYPSGGVEHIFESMALAYFCVFMALFSIVGLLIGLVVWTEEEGEDAGQTLPRQAGGVRGD